MLKRIQRINGRTVHINTDAVTFIKDHSTNVGIVTITLACGTTIDVCGDQERWAKRLRFPLDKRL